MNRYKELQKNNEDLRKRITGILKVLGIEELIFLKSLWFLINKLINNEIEQERL